VLEHRAALIDIADALNTNDELSGDEIGRIVTSALAND
jgi:hypothetical protein